MTVRRALRQNMDNIHDHKTLEKTEIFLEKVVRILNEAAGWILGACMLLVTLNVLLRTIFGKPLLGAYEWVGILTALTISLGLAFCETKGAHITIDFLADKLRPAARNAAAVITGILSSGIMAVVFYSVIRYAFKLMLSGEVSPTTRIPFYLFVFVVGAGFLVLDLILILKTILVLKGVKK